jgi:hypothetical protein
MTGAFVDEALILEAQPSRQRCSAIRLRIWESSLAGTREGCEITGLALLVGLKDTQHRVGPARRMT